MKTAKPLNQKLRCVRDSRHLFADKAYQVTGLAIKEFQQERSNLGVPIYPGYEIKLVGDILFIGQLMLKIRDIEFIYDYVGLQNEIKRALLESGCQYKRITSQRGWFNLNRIPIKKAICVDGIRVSNGFNNLYFKSIIKSDLSLVYSLYGMVSQRSSIQPFIDKIGDAYLFGCHCNESTLCNTSEGLAAKIVWQLTDELIGPFGFRIRHRVNDRFYNWRTMVGNYRTIARTKADALFNTTFQIYEEEMWIVLEELGLNYLGVGGFTHFSKNSNLTWMGLPLDLCDSLKKAGHTQAVKAVLDEEFTDKHVESIVGFKGERLYYVTPVGREILARIRDEIFNHSCVFKGVNYNSLNEALRINVLEFDSLLESICERLHEEQLFLIDKETNVSFAVKLWRLILEWEWLPESQKGLLQTKISSICQDEVKRSGFQPIVWTRSNFIEQQVMESITTFEELSYLFRNRERNYLHRNGHKKCVLSPRVLKHSYELKELPIKWIDFE